MKKLISIVAITASLFSNAALSNSDDTSVSSVWLNQEDIQQHLSAQLPRVDLAVSTSQIRQQIETAVQQAKLTYELNGRLAYAKQSLPTNRFKVVIAE
ncbi:hypothetical protein QTP81_11305 [Alteromonas sp. ASW11-36]|uniref:Uncharacterized protein n=1 Tax=Alteromonas arenosi TaxID=3055817 RepID=A0ABT7SYC4_9ALTE|nr:hypothetical protein [Alteromonas sp. ASW11-36]MDM7861185.1 hypothetical protein [Alteromonas sp. ASW11-36]